MIRAESIAARRGSNEILSGVSLATNRGAFVTITGESGSGKSTLLNVLSSLLSICAGRLIVCDVDISNPTARVRRSFLREHSGFIFQSPNLVPWMTVAENVQLGLQYRAPSEPHGRSLRR